MERQVGQPFTIKVPNGKKYMFDINLSGEQKPRVEVQLLNGNPTPKDAILEQMADQAIKLDLNQFNAGDTIKVVIHEDGGALSNFALEQQQSRSFRDYILEEKKKLYPSFNFKRAICFDQCFYTRGFGFIEIARDLESREQANLAQTHDLFSGVGFGAILAAWYAAGRSTGDLHLWWGKELKAATKGGLHYLRTGQRKPKKLEKALRKAFRTNGRDMLMNELSKELYIPAIDISDRVMPITKKVFPMMPVYQALLCTVLDPINFDTRPIAKGFSIMDLRFKSSVKFISKNNGLITRITCPKRIYDHVNKNRTSQNLAIIAQENWLDDEGSTGNNIIVYEAKPIDEVKRFDHRKKYIEAAIFSGKGIVNV